MKRVTIDIESNDLLANMLDYSSLPYKLNDYAKLWCVVIRDIDTDELVVLNSETGNTITKEQLESALNGVTEIVGHNGIKFDFLVLKMFGVLDYEIGYLGKPDKLFGRDIKVTDTLIRSRLFHPDRNGGHSLKAWGLRLGEHKGDFTDFHNYSNTMLEYCIQDTHVTTLIYKELEKEYNSYTGWAKAEKLENKLADLAVRRETYGFWFDKELAIKCVDDLTIKMQKLQDNVNPLLPPKPMGKTAIKAYTPPKIQFKADGSLAASIIKFADKHDAEISGDLFIYKGHSYKLPLTEPIETTELASISDLDHVKSYLISLGWNPSEFKVRDLTKDTKKQSLPYAKRVETLDRWLNQTFDEGKYKYHRLQELGLGTNKAVVREKLLSKLADDKPVRVPTSPAVRVGIEKELCPNLISLGSKVDFANDFTLFLTYKHRKSSIAGGDIDDMDFDDEVPSTGLLSMYRESDGRIPTPAIEIGSNTHRYRHIGVCNVPRVSSIYGSEMRSLFGCGKGMFQLGFDFSSLEARIQGHYIMDFNGADLAKQLLASKPNDIHSVTGKKLNLTRDQAKSISYMLMYGGSASKAKKMLGISQQEAEDLVQQYWSSVQPLSDLRDKVAEAWRKRGREYVVGIDGRKIITRSQHSLLNALFQSGGVICAKYSTVFLFELLESQGLKCNPFEYSSLDVCSMIEYHDELQLAVNPKLIEIKQFENDDECEEFISNWQGDQLGAKSELKNGKPCLALPNIVSRSIIEAIKMADDYVNLKVNLGCDWVVNKDWKGCH